MTFTLTDPLPAGTTVIQASAGTGKTYAIVGLATRVIAEGTADVEQLMLVTFGRAATLELRDRARERFVECARALAVPVAARASRDILIRHLATGTDPEVGERRRRLLRALSDFDAATIVTTHAFCRRMLDGIGLAGDYEPAANFRDNVDDMLTEVIEDRYLADYRGELAPALTLADARVVARAAAGDPQAAVEPADAAPGTEAALRVAFAAAARDELTRRKRTYGIRDYDDLQQLLCDALADPAFGPIACARIQARYRFVLVDEFQDTDPIQWDILRRAFHGVVNMVLVGDPKQTIYAFRGGDVTTYLTAVEDAGGDPEELAVNWRTDDDLLTALDNVYGGAALGPDQIRVYR
jgi:exodeoxyribonuclease V beta subunit